jgi:hypothetical protein
VGTGLLMLALPAFLLYDGRAGLARKRDEETARADALNLNPWGYQALPDAAKQSLRSLAIRIELD